MPEHTKIRFLANPGLTAMGLGVMFAIPAYGVFGGVFSSWMIQNALDSVIFLCILYALWLGVCVWCFPKWIIIVTVDERSIRYKQAFKKPVEVEWKKYRNIHPATYYHGSVIGVGYYPDFLVLATRSVSMHELRSINHVAVDEELIKIRITKRSYRKLHSILPPYPKHILEKYFAEKYGEKKT